MDDGNYVLFEDNKEKMTIRLEIIIFLKKTVYDKHVITTYNEKHFLKSVITNCLGTLQLFDVMVSIKLHVIPICILVEAKIFYDI